LNSFSADDVFQRRGALAATHPGFEFRPGQLEMACAVEQAFADGGALLAEAGTGTGKTLAYLVPAVQCGRRVVVSTATRNLQEQIARKEVPFLQNELGLSFSAMTMKGRENYLCLHRYDEFRREPRFQFVDEVEPFGAVKNWAETTATGDRAEVPGLPDGVRFWREINARSDTCLGRRCPVYDDCHLVRMRRQAEQTQVLIVNHHLLFADLAVRRGDFGQVIPDYDCLILDEAHKVEGIATQYFGRRFSSWQLKDLAEEAARQAAAAGMARRVLSAVEAVQKAGGALFGLLRSAGEGRFRLESGERRVEASSTAAGLQGELNRLQLMLGELTTGEDDDEDEKIVALRRRCSDAGEDLQETVRGEDPAMVRWFEVRGAGAVLHASPIDVSSSLRDLLFRKLRTTVVTSATLTVAGSFRFVRARLGLEEAEEIGVASPFDYEEQGVIFLPRGLPEPRSPQFIPEAGHLVRRLLDITRGRAFLLFTSFAYLGAMRALLEESSEYPLLVQGDQPREYLLERFQKTPGAVLLGTASFWEGVDVPGEALSLVVIDRLPFAVPDDPLLSARLDDIRRRGGEPFMDYQIPEAVLSLKQGAGRLIRTRRDRGILCILDPRLTGRRYGAAFARSLPPFRPLEDLDEVKSFFGASGD
jgi:ATP-dependent DNA helicase DinG